MKNVKFLVSTAFRGPRREGEVISVPDDYASRWVKNGIAEYCEKQEQVQKPEYAEDEPLVEDEDEPLVEEKDINEMTTKELYTLCKENGIDAEAKKSKEYYLEKLTGSEKAE